MKSGVLRLACVACLLAGGLLQAEELMLALAPPGRPAAPVGDTLLEVQAPPGYVLVPVEVRLSTADLTGPDGPQSWSLSIQNDPCVQVERITVKGLSVTVLAWDFVGNGPEVLTIPLRQQSDVFPPEAVGVAYSTATGEDPSPLPDDARGVISVALLGLAQKVVLRPNVTESVLSIIYRIRAPEEGSVTCRAYFSDGLRSDLSQPIPNVITWQGLSRRPTSTQGITIVVSTAPPSAFIRGDPNGDGRADIADAIWMIWDLFLVPVMRTGCRDAGDSNGDGGFDIADPVHLLGYLFQGGPRPPEPYPSCGRGPTTTPHSCPAGSGGCP